MIPAIATNPTSPKSCRRLAQQWLCKRVPKMKPKSASPRLSSPELLGRLPGGVPGKIGVLGRVLRGNAGGAAWGLLAGVPKDCLFSAPHSKAQSPGTPPAIHGHFPQHNPRFGEFGLGGSSGWSRDLKTLTLDLFLGQPALLGSP